MTFDPTIVIGQLAAELSCHIGFQDGGISSAVAKRPRDASCLSVVSLSSAIPRAQFFY